MVADEHWSQVGAIFDRARRLNPEERLRFLDEECEAPEVRSEVESLLRHHSAEYLETPDQSPGALLEDTWSRRLEEALGRALESGLRTPGPLDPGELVREAAARMPRSETPLSGMRGALAQHLRTLLLRRSRAQMAHLDMRSSTGGPARTMDFAAVEELLGELRQQDPLDEQIVVLHYFGGMAPRDIASLVDLSPQEVEGRLSFAIRWVSSGSRSPPIAGEQGRHGPPRSDRHNL